MTPAPVAQQSTTSSASRGAPRPSRSMLEQVPEIASPLVPVLIRSAATSCRTAERYSRSGFEKDTRQNLR
jgi:hypothetical protein